MAKVCVDWSYKGMRTVTLENRLVKVSILLDKGSDIFELVYKPLDIDLIWHSPTGYRNPASHIQDVSSPADVFHDYYGGGWNDIFPNYGNPSSNRGAKFVGHAESALLPWNCSESSEKNGIASVNLSADCVRYPIRAEKKITLASDKPLLTISEDLINLGEQSVEISWAQHIAYGEPFVGPDLRIDVPATRAVTSTFEVSNSRLAPGMEFKWPLAPGANGGKVDLSRLPERSYRVQEDFPIFDLRPACYDLYNAKLDLGVRVNWNRETFPILWYWLYWGVLDYPFFGRGRTLALEPTTSSTGRGLADDVEHGSAKILNKNSRLHADLSFNMFRRVKAKEAP